MIRSILNLITCQHNNTTFPQSPRRHGPVAAIHTPKQATCVCLDCGAEFSVDTETMVRGARVDAPTHGIYTSPEAGKL